MPNSENDAYGERIDELTEAGRKVAEDKGDTGSGGPQGHDAARTEADPALSGADAVPDTHERSHHASHDEHGQATRE